MNERCCSNCGKAFQPGDTVCRFCGHILPIISKSSLTMMVGQVLQGRYELQEIIHSGGMGYIYLAKDKRLYDRHCVVKQVKEPIRSDQHQKKLEEEALRMAKLNHPSVAMILDHFIEGNLYFLVVELISGKTLSEIFKQRDGKLREQEVIQWAVSMCSVVEYLHREGVIHRDISPDNVMLTDNGTIKFIDFGTLRELTSLFGKGTVGIGKFGYTPPEQWQGKPEPRSDIFALGATIYNLLTGFLPLSQQYLKGQSPQTADFRPTFPPIRTKNQAITPFLESVLQKALNLDIAERYQTATQFNEDLKKAAKEEKREVPILNIDVSRINFSGIKHGDTATETFIVKNTGNGKLVGKISSSHQSITVSPSKINLEMGECRVEVKAHTKDITAGSTINCILNIISNGGNTEIPLILSTIKAPEAEPVPVLNVEKDQIVFKGAKPGISTSATFTIKNTGPGKLVGTITANQPWLSVSPSEISLETGKCNIKVLVRTNDFTPGSSPKAIINISSNAGNYPIPVILSIAEVSKKVKREPPKNITDTICPKCAVTNEKDLIYCKNCGTQLINETQSCINCGKDIPVNALYCRYCGYRLNTPVKAKTNRLLKQGKKRLIIVPSIFVIVMFSTAISITIFTQPAKVAQTISQSPTVTATPLPTTPASILPALEPDKGRIVFTSFKSPPQAITARSIKTDFFVGAGTCCNISSTDIVQLRSSGINDFLLEASWGKIETMPGSYGGHPTPGVTGISLIQKINANLTGYWLIFLRDESRMIPEFTKGKNYTEIKQMLANYVKAMVQRYPGVKIWDLQQPIVQNAFGWSKEECYDIFVSASKWVHAANPQAKVMINMNPNLNLNTAYDPNKVIDDLLSRGMEADIIGVGLHYASSVNNRDADLFPKLDWTLGRIDVFRKYKLPIILTSVDVPAMLMGRDVTAIQANYLEALLRKCKSDKDVMGVYWLYYYDNPTCGIPSPGLVNLDRSHRPVMDRLGKLIDEWNPKTTLQVNDKGYVDIAPGLYDISFEADKDEFYNTTAVYRVNILNSISNKISPAGLTTN